MTAGRNRAWRLPRRIPTAAAAVCILVPIAAGALLAGENPAPPDPAADDEVRHVARLYTAFAQVLRRQVLRADHCPYDPASVVMHVGGDPQALARFVREHIAYEPYGGSVRGAEGTLAARAGSDWDRAVLLQALLAEAGFASRLRVVDRTADERNAVVDAFLKQDPRPRTLYAAGSRPADELPPASPLLKRFGVPRTYRDFQTAKAVAYWQRLLDEAYDAACLEAPWIRQAAGRAAIGRSFQAWRDELLEGAAERAVVEVAGEGPAVMLCVAPEANEVSAERLAKAPALDAPGPDRVSRLSLRLRMTLGGEAAPKEPIVLMEGGLNLAGLFRRPMRLEIAPVGEKAATKPPTQWTMAEWHANVTAFERFQAGLWVGSGWSGSKVFDLAGRVHDVTADGRIKAAEEMGGGLRRGFGGVFGGDDEPAEPKTHIESIVLELELRLPGRKPLRQQRLLVGRLRPGVSCVYVADIMAVSGPVDPLTTSWLTLRALAKNAPIYAELVTSSDPKRFGRIGSVARMPRILYEWQLARLALADRILAGEGSLTLLGGPAVAMWTTQLVADDRRKAVAGRTALDVVWDGQLLAPRTPKAAPMAAESNVRLGVASTVFESLLLRELATPLAIRGAFAESQLFQAKGGGAVVRRPGQAPARGEGRPTPVAAWAIARNEPDRLLIFPQAEPLESWWSIDPATGHTIGRGDGGEGQSLMEYLQALKLSLTMLKCYLEWLNRMINEQNPSAGAAISSYGTFLACAVGIDNTEGQIGALGKAWQFLIPWVPQPFSMISDALSIGRFLVEEKGVRNLFREKGS
jgi:hypothetical protein